MQEGDEFLNALGEWKDLHAIHRGNTFTKDCRPVRRRVTVPVAAPAPVADAPKSEPSWDYADYRERLFKYAEENFGHTLINSEMDEIEHIVLGYFKHKANEPKVEPVIGKAHKIAEAWSENIERGNRDYARYCFTAGFEKAMSLMTTGTESGPYLVSVDGHEAPTREHSNILDARVEADRLARQEAPAQVRLLRQVAVAKSEVTVKWEESK